MSESHYFLRCNFTVFRPTYHHHHHFSLSLSLSLSLSHTHTHTHTHTHAHTHSHTKTRDQTYANALGHTHAHTMRTGVEQREIRNQIWLRQNLCQLPRQYASSAVRERGEASRADAAGRIASARGGRGGKKALRRLLFNGDRNVKFRTTTTAAEAAAATAATAACVQRRQCRSGRSRTEDCILSCFRI